MGYPISTMHQPIEDMFQYLKASGSGLSAAEAGILSAGREFFTSLRALPEKLTKVWATAESDWDRQSHGYRDSIIRLMTGMVGLGEDGRAFYERHQSQFAPEAARVYEQDLRAFVACVTAINAKFEERLAEDVRRGKELTDLALAQPDFREAVQRSREEIADGKSRKMTGDDFRDRIRKRRERSC